MSENKVRPDGGRKVGNTIRPSSSIHWCFTYNNYQKCDIQTVRITLDRMARKFVFQEEIGENGTPHLQGYVAFKKRCRPLGIGMSDKIHWEKCRSPMHSIAYCSDPKKRAPEGRVFVKGVVIPEIIKVLDPQKFYPWQKRYLSLLKEEPDDRTIHWVWEATGNVGKSAFTKYLVVKEDALIVSGKGSDIKYGVVSYFQKKLSNPKIIIIDIPRSMLQYISYTAIEEIKNGCFFSGKYECCTHVQNCPHVLIFANEEPDYEKMSSDRWKVHQINMINKSLFN